MSLLRTGEEYRAALRDGRKVWLLGAGAVDDVATHPATRAMVDEYVAWYDRHHDAAWQETLLRPEAAQSQRRPWGYMVPRTAEDLVGMGRSFAATTFLSAGNITHTPAYGHLIALGLLATVQDRNVSAAQISTLWPSPLNRFANFPIVVVFPTPFTPTIITTVGGFAAHFIGLSPLSQPRALAYGRNAGLSS